MLIEIEVKWEVPVTDPDKIEESKNRRIIYGDEDLEAGQETEVNYDLLTMDIDDIKSFHRYDDEHTIIRTYDQDNYCIHYPYDQWLEFYLERTNQLIISLKKSEK